MGEHTAIAWTDATVNWWWGCTKVGPGCDHCYAEKWSERTGHKIWGVGVPRRKIESASKMVAKLDKTRPGARVFVSSMCDIFDLEVPAEWFIEAWSWIRVAQCLRFQIVTKRISAIEKRLDTLDMPWPRHAGLIITVVNQEEADRDVPRMLALKDKLGIPWLGLSVEPQIGPITLRQEWLVGISWCIGGGESKQGKDHVPRPYDIAWARSLRDQCAAAGVAYFQKQLGAHPVMEYAGKGLQLMAMVDRRAGADPSEWPADLRVQQFPDQLR